MPDDDPSEVIAENGVSPRIQFLAHLKSISFQIGQYRSYYYAIPPREIHPRDLGVDEGIGAYYHPVPGTNSLGQQQLNMTGQLTVIFKTTCRTCPPWPKVTVPDVLALSHGPGPAN